MTSLTEETLAELNADVSVPRYDRHRVTTGIVHIGVGGFHRSHQTFADLDHYATPREESP
jgi:mannitol 2-dehydrogenase